MTEPDTRVPLPPLTVRPVALPEPVLQRTPGPQIATPSVQPVSSAARHNSERTAPVPASCSAQQHCLGKGRARAAQGDVSCSCASASPEKPIMNSLDAPDARWSRSELHAGRSTPPSTRSEPELPSGHAKAGQA